MSVTLNLRITGGSSWHRTKSPNVKEENIPLVVNKLRHQANGVVGRHAFLDELEKSVDLKSQIELLKKGCNVLEGDIDQELFYCTVLVEILLSLEFKSPLRSGVIRILKNRSSSTKAGNLEQIIANGLISRYSECQNDVYMILTVANAVCSCFDNFSVGLDGMGICVLQTHNFIVDSIALCKHLLRTETSTELCQCVHGLVRAALHISSLPSVPDLSALHQLAYDLVALGLPLDTRTNCGLLVAVTAQNLWPQVLANAWSRDDDLTALCIYSGLISSLTIDEMQMTVKTFNKTTLYVLFDSVMAIHMRHPLHPTVTLSVARALVSLTRTHSQALLTFIPRLLTYCWEHLEHVMDSVKHLAASLLDNIVNMHSPEVDVHRAILTAIKSMPVESRARHLALSNLVGKVTVSQLLAGPDDVDLMYRHLNQELVSSHAVNTFQALLKQHYQEVEDKEEWHVWWVTPLLRYLDSNQSVPLQQVLAKVILVSPQVVPYVMSLSEDDVSLSTQLICLRHAHKQGLLPDGPGDGGKWKGLVDYALLYAAVHHQDEQTRLLCLSLVVEGPRSTESFTTEELNLIKEYVCNNMNLDYPASRQRSIALLKKFVNRLDESRQVLQRQPQKTVELLKGYTECRHWLEQYCVDSLFPGASYSRRTTALHLLSALGVNTVDHSTPATLLACLADSYEELKQLAMTLLVSTPGLLQIFVEPETVARAIEKSLAQAGDVKPPECLTAAYLLATLSHVPFSPSTLVDVMDKYGLRLADEAIESKTVYCLLLIVLDRLTQQLRVAEVSVLRAASSAPLYGLLFTAKLLLSQLDLRQCTSESWRQLVKDLVDVSFRCSQAVASVVNSDSPEGHLPMDFDFDLTEVCEGVNDGLNGVTSQMVLLCSWRTVKEVSLLLGFLTEKATIATPEDEGLLVNEDILRIGEHLTTLLTETKHRGAFEQAYIGFCKLVSRLWRLPAGPLKELPQMWLEEMMQEIFSNSETMCATRRSAGIPFMVQALISTQLGVKGLSSVETWFKQLLAAAESVTVIPTARTHALNILRALVRSNQLGEAVGMYVQEAFMVTIAAFGAATWMERNSATLLLSALMTRVFGVPRSKSQEKLGWKNKMTGRIFFQRYPKLFGFFQTELKKASHHEVANVHPTLYPVLLVLGRLYPSSLEGTDSNLQLTQFIEDIELCAGSNIYKTRTLAASAAVALMSVSHLESLVTKITNDALTRNHRHGLFLQVAYYLEHSEQEANNPILKLKASTWIVQLLTLLRQTSLSCIELEAMFQVISRFLEICFHFVPYPIWTEVMHVSRCVMVSSQNHGQVGPCQLRCRVSKLLLRLAMMRGGSELTPLCCDLLQDRMYEVRHTALAFIGCSISSTSGCPQMCDSVEETACKMLDNNFLNDQNLISVFVQTAMDMLFNPTKNTVYAEDKAKILQMLWMWKKAFVQMLKYKSRYTELTHVFFLTKLCRDTNELVAVNSMCCLCEFMSLKDVIWPEEEIEEVCQLLTDLSTPEMRDIFGTVILDLISKQFGTLQKSQNPVSRLQVYKLYIELSDSSQWSVILGKVCKCESDETVTAVLLTALALGQSEIDLPATTESTVHVFDKEEVSSEYEEYILSKLCVQKLTTLPSEVINCTLDENVREWLTAQTGLSANSLAEAKALFRLQDIHLKEDRILLFLRPGHQRLRLNSLKIKTIVLYVGLFHTSDIHCNTNC